MDTSFDLVVANDLFDQRRIAYIAGIEGKIDVYRCPMAVSEVVQNYDRLAASAKRLNSHAADITGSTSDQNVHMIALL